MNVSATHWLQALHLLSLGVMTGVIIYVQIVHYPLFALVGNDSFYTFHQAHSKLTTWVVAPAMGLELVTAIALCLVKPQPLSALYLFFNLALIIVAWMSTAFIQVPLHHQLATVSVEHRLLILDTQLATNWIRSLAWCLRSIAWLVWLGSFFKKNMILPLIGVIIFCCALVTASPLSAATPNTDGTSWPWAHLQSLGGTPCQFKGHSTPSEKHTALPTVIIVAFNPKEQKTVNTWLDALAHRGRVMEVPILEPHWLKVKTQATQYMKSQVKKEHHTRVCPLFQTHSLVATQLGLNKKLTGIYVFLVDVNGTILKKERGTFSLSKLAPFYD